MTAGNAHDPAPPPGAPRTRLDVRPILARGEEPYGAIMDAVEHLPPGGVLALETPFDPTPLHRVLGGKGFARHSAELGENHVITEYWRPTAGPAAGDGVEVVLDVRGMEPPRPMELTLHALDELPPGARLVQLNERVPAFLLPELDARGFAYAIRPQDDGVIVSIWRPGQ